jgi:hypothetical protein
MGGFGIGPSGAKALRLLGLAAALMLGPRPAAAESPLSGRWQGPVGEVIFVEDGDGFEGRLAADSPVCPFRQGEPVLRGTVVAGSMTANVRLCLTGCEVAEADRWAFALLVVQPERLAGAAHVAADGCTVPGRGPGGSVVLERLPDPGPAPEGDGLPVGLEVAEDTYDPRRSADVRERALAEARVGAALLGQGRFEAARKRFEAAVALDPTYAEGYNGIGVTHALRRDWEEAVVWYRRSIAAGPDIGDAYYNLACAYAQTGEADLAVRYLRLAVLNGYMAVDHLREDPDLEPLRERADFAAVLQLGEIAAGAH